jgi:Na+/H+-dicarboxylate symporter
MESFEEAKHIGARVLRYTILTTVLAALVAMGLYLIIEPASVPFTSENVYIDTPSGLHYSDYLLKMVPSNLVEPFLENQVIGVLILAVLLSVALLSIPNENRRQLHVVFHSLFAAVMHLCTSLIRWIPVAIFGFITLFVVDLKKGMEFERLALYLLCVILANLIQGFIVLPLFLKWRGVSPVKLFRAMLPALTMAFFTKSSSAALPVALRCAEGEAKIDAKVANFSFPLCTTINMNGCAAFIFTTVIFVGMSQGIPFSLGEMFLWVLLATIAAIGNAGVPMGCFFLTSALLAAMNVPLTLMGVILPFYSLIDMLESSINVWSDASVTAAVDRDLASKEAPAKAVLS